MPDSFLAFDEANSYLDKQQRSLDYLDRIQKLSVITKTSIDLKSTNGYNRAEYINKLNHLSKLPTTSIVFTKSALKEHVGKPISVAEFKGLADELNSDDDSMQVEVGGVLMIVDQQSPAEAMHKLIQQFRDQGTAMNGAWKVPIVASENVKFVNMNIDMGESNDAMGDQEEDLYEQVKKLTNDPEYERQIDNRIEKAYANKLCSGAVDDDENDLDSNNIWKSEDFTIYPDTMDDRNREIEQAKKLIDEIVHSNTARFVTTKEEKDEE